MSSVLEIGKHSKKNFQLGEEYYSFNFCPREDENIIDIFGTDISEEIKHQTYFSVISAFSTALLEAQTEEEVAWTIAKEAIARLNFVDCVVYLVDRKDGRLKQRAAHGPKSPKAVTNSIVDPISLNFGQGLVGACAVERKTILVDDVSKDKRYVIDDEQRNSEVAVPILAGFEVIGVIDSEHPEKNHFTKEDVKILESIASIASTRIQRSRVIEEIKHTEEKYRSFVENAFGGLYIFRDNNFEYANEQFCQMVGYAAEELGHPDFNIKDLIYSADEAAMVAMESRGKGDYAPKSYNLEVKTKDGTIRQIAINTCVLKDEKGEFSLGVALDITDTIKSRKQLEEVIQSLEKKSNELNEFAHLASHNLRSPVTNLKGLIDHYEFDGSAESTNDIIVRKFANTVQQLHTTLEDMHQVLKVRANESFEFTEIHLDTLLEGVKYQLSEIIRKNDFFIVTEFEVNRVFYEKSHLENLFLNLVSNAIKYRRPEKKSTLKIRTSLVNNGLRIEFQDNGLGLDLSKHGKKIFGMYTRFHNNIEGRGVGLYLVKRQLDSLGGKIYVESEPGLGTKFTVLLKLEK